MLQNQDITAKPKYNLNLYMHNIIYNYTITGNFKHIIFSKSENQTINLENKSR